MCTAPTGSNESQGPIERYHQAIHDQVRTLRLSLGTHFKIEAIEIQSSHPIMTWITRRAAWLLNHYLVHDDGITSYQMRFKSTINPALVEFAEHVHYKLHGKHNLTKCGPSYPTWLWLGKYPESGEHIVATRTTFVKARSIKRYTCNERVDIELLQGLISVSWNLKGDGTYDPAFITDWDPSKGMYTSDQYHDDLNVPTLVQDEPPPAGWGSATSTRTTTFTTTTSTYISEPTSNDTIRSMSTR